MVNSELVNKLKAQDISVSLEHILDNSKAHSGGDRDVNFFLHLIENKLLVHSEAVLKRKDLDKAEEYYLERYKRIKDESDRHYLSRIIVQDELKNLNIETIGTYAVGNMEILRANSSYDIVTLDMGAIIDIGLTPARNFFRGLTDLRVKNYLLTTYFDDYIDDIIFSVFTRSSDSDYLDAVRDFEEGFKVYTPNPHQDTSNYNHPSVT